MKLLRLILILLGYITLSYSIALADTKNDSLLQLFRKYTTEGRKDTAYANVILTLSADISVGNPKEAIKYLLEAEKIYSANNMNKQVTDAYYQIGQIYTTIEMFPMAIEYYEKCIKLQQELGITGNPYIFIDVANLFFAQGIYDITLDYYRQAVTLFVKTNDLYGAAVAYNNIALVYESKGDLDSAIVFFNMGLENRKKLNSPFLIAHSYNYIGRLYMKKEYYEKAISIFGEIITMLKKIEKPDNEEMELLGTAHLNLGSIYIKQKMFNDALRHFSKGLSNFEKIGDAFAMSGACYTIGDVYFEQKQMGEAEKYYTKGYTTSRLNHYMNLEHQGLFRLTQAAFKSQKLDTAGVYLKRYSELTDSLLKKQISTKLSAMQAGIETYSKEKENQVLTKKITTGNYMLVALLALLVLFVALSTFYITALKRMIQQLKQSALNNADGIIFHTNGLVTEANERFLEMTGYSEGELQGMKVADVILVPETGAKNIARLVTKNKKELVVDIYEQSSLQVKGKKVQMIGVREIIILNTSGN